MQGFLPFAAAIVATMGLFFGGCTQDRETASVLKLGYFANVTHAQAVVGVHTGRFERAIAPVAIKTKVFNAGPSLIEALFAGEIDVGYVGPGPALNGYLKSRGEGLTVIAGAAEGGVSIVVGSRSAIKDVADLRAKRVATPQLGNTQDISARYFFAERFGSANAATVIPVPNAEQLALMERGQIDAAWVPEPWGTLLVERAGARVLATENVLWPEVRLPIALIVATPAALKRLGEPLRKLLIEHAALTSELARKPQSFVDPLRIALGRLTGTAPSAKVLSQSLKNVQFTTKVSAAPFEAMLKRMKTIGMLPAPSSSASNDLSRLVAPQ